MTTEYNSSNAAHVFAKEVVLEVIKSKGDNITKSFPEEECAKVLAKFVTTLFDEIIARIDEQPE
jgi:restriction endonuclease Mrr